MSKTYALADLKAAKNREDVAKILGIEVKKLTYLLYVLPADQRYTSFEIPKKLGGVRVIDAPRDDLKKIQKELAGLLQRCIDEITGSDNGRMSIASYGFVPGGGIARNAKLHRARRWVFNIDLHDFFGSISFARIYGFLQKHDGFLLQKPVATTVAQLACHKSRLPQGAPTSPIFSNLIASILDFHLIRLAQRMGCTYSRYADDLTFSTNANEFPSAIARQSAEGVWELGKELRGILKKCDFEPNPAKTRMQYRQSRQDVTGLVVNRRVNVRYEYRREARAMAHSLFTTGKFYVGDKSNAESIHGTEVDAAKALDRLHGMLGFVHGVDEFHFETSQRAPEKESASLALYIRFLLFRFLFANPHPLIICEGKTDNIYLSRAIHALHANFPDLLQMGKNNKKILSVRFFKFSDGAAIGKLLGIHSGGGSNIASLLRKYAKACEGFVTVVKQQPVIFLMDNDSGSNAIKNDVKKIAGRPVVGDEDFVHIFGNAYLILTPKAAGQEASEMEDFFDGNAKSEIIDGKTFNPGKDADPAQHYGKAIFAYKVVVGMADKINFNGFQSLLDRVRQVIAHQKAL